MFENISFKHPGSAEMSGSPAVAGGQAGKEGEQRVAKIGPGGAASGEKHQEIISNNQLLYK